MPPAASETPWPQPITPAKRNRLQQCYEHGRANLASGNYDYAVEMFTNSLTGDPGNVVYAQSFLDTLYKKYNNNKKGSGLAGIKGTTLRRSLKKARERKDWDNVVKSALELLRLNPWDTQVLIAMAAVCEAAKSDECQLFFLKAALDTNPKDAEVNRLAAQALTRIGQFEQAIVCWHRVEQALPNDHQARKEIGELTVVRQLPRQQQQEWLAKHNGLQGNRPAAPKPQPSQPAPAPKPEPAREPEPELSPAERLQQAIAEQPEETKNYLELAEIYLQADRFDDAEAQVQKALEVSGGGDLKIRERLEDYQIRRRVRQYEIAEQRAKASGDEEAQQLARRMKSELNRVELEVFAARCERSPGNEALQYELGLRLKRAGKFDEAVQSLQQALNYAPKKGAAYLELGECFQYLKQYRLAMTNYDQAIAAADEKDLELRKLALYRAGVLATGLRDWDTAEKWLTELVSLDARYKDVTERLDKLNQLRNSK